MYLLDTDHFGIVQLRDGDIYWNVKSKLEQLPSDAVAGSIVSFHEQLNGWQAYLRKQRTPKQVVYAYRRLEGVIRDFSRWPLASYDEDAVRLFGELRKLRVRIDTMDLRIAAIALVRDDILLTRNSVDFEKVPGLKFKGLDRRIR